MAIKEMFTTDALRTSTDGKTQNGKDSIGAFYEQTLKNDVKVAIKQAKVVTENDDSIVATGTYQVTGSSTTGEKIDIKGAYTNTVVKDGSQWKIAKQIPTAL
jgi:uncharacterized protein (TIGR02246 family)